MDTTGWTPELSGDGACPQSPRHQETPTLLQARLAGTRATVTVVLSDHAIERFVERIQPCCDRATATTRIAVLFGFSEVEAHPPSWSTRLRPAPLFLTVGDVAFVLDVDARERGRLVATTCLVRGTPGFRGRRRRRSARPESPRAPRPYRRPAPGQLAFDHHH